MTPASISTSLPPLCMYFCKRRRKQRDAWNQRGKTNFNPPRGLHLLFRGKSKCAARGLSSALYASFSDSPVFSSAGSTVKFARECNNPVFLTADLTHFFPFMKQHMHGDLEPLVTSCREVPWKPGRQTHRCDGTFQHFCLDESKTLWLPLGHGTKAAGCPGTPQPRGWVPGACGGPAPSPSPPPSQPGPGSGCAFPSSSSGLREINRSSGACSQPSFPCDPSELRLRQRALFPGPAEGMFYS